MKMQPDAATQEELKRLELLLMDPDVRRDRERVDGLLAPEFVEFGSSGRVWTRAQTLELLGSGAFTVPRAEEFTFLLLGPGVVLVSYRAVGENAAGAETITLRSSIWIRESGGWQVCFHQGTRTG